MISLRDVVTGFCNRDPLAEVWRRNLRGGGGSAEITGVPPLRYIGDGRPLIDYLISGNAVQDGTPSADAPVDATGSGVRTGNLFDKNATDTNNGYVDGSFLVSTGATTSSTAYFVSEYIPVSAGESYTLVYSDGTLNSPSFCLYNTNKEYVSGNRYGNQNPVSFTVPDGVSFMRFSAAKSNKDIIMLNLGSTALPYEPYGYKLPLTINGTEYPIYLGQVETTRRVKKLVLTGDGNVGKNYADPNNTLYYLNFTNYHVPFAGSAVALCTHLTPSSSLPSSEAGIRVSNSGASLYINFGADVMNAQTSGNTVDGLKEYLAAQYANGTPVTIWYVLATEETGIVNEPLMKIGGNADTISFAQAGVTIPTVSGANVLDVPTTVPPSEITIKGGIRSV